MFSFQKLSGGKTALAQLGIRSLLMNRMQMIHLEDRAPAFTGFNNLVKQSSETQSDTEWFESWCRFQNAYSRFQ